MKRKTCKVAKELPVVKQEAICIDSDLGSKSPKKRPAQDPPNFVKRVKTHMVNNILSSCDVTGSVKKRAKKIYRILKKPSVKDGMLAADALS